MRDGIIPIDKAEEYTSHDVIARMRGILGTRKIGHAGTLDPMATGVLVLFVGNATKAVDRIPDHDKAYTATYKLGVTTDTQDITGTIIEEKPVTVSKADVLSAVENFKGKIFQIPPMYSAVQIDGKRLYELARKGYEVERPHREITIYEYNLLDCNEEKGEYTFNIRCSKGTYIRTLCHDLGQALGCGATLTALRRTYANGFAIEETYTLDEIQELAKQDKIDTITIPLETAFKDYKKLILDTRMATMFCNGVPLWLNQFDIDPDDSWLRIYGPNDIFIGIAKASSQTRQLAELKRFIGEVSF